MFTIVVIFNYPCNKFPKLLRPVHVLFKFLHNSQSIITMPTLGVARIVFLRVKQFVQFLSAGTGKTKLISKSSQLGLLLFSLLIGLINLQRNFMNF